MIFPIDPQRTNIKQKFHPFIIGVNEKGKPVLGFKVDYYGKVLCSITPVMFPIDPVRSMIWCNDCGGKCTRTVNPYGEEPYAYSSDTECYICLRDLENSDELDRGICDGCDSKIIDQDDENIGERFCACTRELINSDELDRGECDTCFFRHIGFHTCGFCGKIVETDVPVPSTVYCSLDCYTATKPRIVNDEGVVHYDIIARICRNCWGQTLLSASDYCTNCGYPVTGAPETAL